MDKKGEDKIEKHSCWRWLERGESIAIIITLIILITGLYYTSDQINQNKNLNRKRYTYVVMKLVQDPNYVDAHMRISIIANLVSEQKLDCNSVSPYYSDSSPQVSCEFNIAKDINLISRRLESMIYIHDDDIGEKAIIVQRIKKDVIRFVSNLLDLRAIIDVEKRIEFFNNFLKRIEED